MPVVPSNDSNALPPPRCTLFSVWPVVQYLSMCADGAEGTTYAILTTLSNVAGAAAATLGSVFAKIWDVQNDTLK